MIANQSTQQGFHVALDKALRAHPHFYPNPCVYAYLVGEALDGAGEGLLQFQAADESDVPATALCAFPADTQSLGRLLGMSVPAWPAKNEVMGIYCPQVVGTIMRLAAAGQDPRFPSTEATALEYAVAVVKDLSSHGYSPAAAQEERSERRVPREGEAGVIIREGRLTVPNRRGGWSWTFPYDELAAVALGASVKLPFLSPRDEGTARTYALKIARDWLGNGYSRVQCDTETSRAYNGGRLADFDLGAGELYVENEAEKYQNKGWRFQFADLEAQLLGHYEGLGIAVESDYHRRRGELTPAEGLFATYRYRVDTTALTARYNVPGGGIAFNVEAQDPENAVRQFMAWVFVPEDRVPGNRWPVFVRDPETNEILGRFEANVNSQGGYEVTVGQHVEEESRNQPGAGRGAAVLITDPHGAHALCPLAEEDGKTHTVGNTLFELSELGGKDGKSLVLTGEELSSLATQWLRFCEGEQMLAARAASDADDTRKVYHLDDGGGSVDVEAYTVEAAVEEFRERYYGQVPPGNAHAFVVRVGDAADGLLASYEFWDDGDGRVSTHDLALPGEPPRPVREANDPFADVEPAEPAVAAPRRSGRAR